MFVDDQAELASDVAFDLEAVRPGPGKPINMWANLDSAGTLTITHGTTTAAADSLMTVDCDGITEFQLPSSTLRYIKSTFSGRVAVSMKGVQTNK